MSRHRTLLALAAVTALSRVVVTLVLCVGWAHGNPIAHDLAGDAANWFLFDYDFKYLGTPHVDVTREYPVGATLLYLLLSPVWDAQAPLWRFLLWHGALMAVADVANTILFHDLVRRVSPQRAVFLTLVFALNLTALVLSPVRYESWIVTSVLVGLHAARRGHPRAAAFALSLGTWLKWFPALLMPAAHTESERVASGARWRDTVLVFALVALALNGPFLLLGWQRTGGIGGWLATYRFHVQRPLYPDTVLGVAEMWLGPVPIERWASLWSLALVGAALVWGRTRGVPRTGVVVCAAALVLNRVYSPQFHLWFYPLLLLLVAEQDARDSRRLLWTFAALDVLNVLVFPPLFHYTLRELGSAWKPVPAPRAGAWAAAFSVAVVLRSIVIGALGVMVLRLPATDRSAGDLVPAPRAS